MIVARRWLPAFLLVLVPLALAFAASESGAPPKKIERARRKYEAMNMEFKSIQQEVEGYLRDLAAIEKEYRKKGITPKLTERRNRIVVKFRLPQERFYDLKRRLYVFQKVGVFKEAAAVGSQGFGGKGIPEDAAEAIALPYSVLEKYREVRAFSVRLGREIGHEQEAFEKAMSVVRHRQARTRWAFGLATAVVLGILIGYWKKRQKVPVIEIPAQPAAAVPAPAVPAAPVMPELLDGNFRIGREIGRGGMGLVFEATDEALDRKVAIKRMKKEVLENRRELDMFLEEARLVAALKHPNIVEIHSIVREAGQLYLVFEYVEGNPLHRLIEEEEQLPLGRASGLMRQLAEALDYAHSKKVIHRDLKPANIMIGEDDAVKIMDFGLAHQAKKTVAKLTQAVAWGTPPYMSPEQELGKVSRESDIYSLGAVYYEMLTGDPVFIGPDFLKQKRELDYEPATKLRPELPAGVDSIVRKALAVRPEDRFHTGAEFIAAVEGLGKA